MVLNVFYGKILTCETVNRTSADKYTISLYKKQHACRVYMDEPHEHVQDHSLASQKIYI